MAIKLWFSIAIESSIFAWGSGLHAYAYDRKLLGVGGVCDVYFAFVESRKRQITPPDQKVHQQQLKMRELALGLEREENFHNRLGS